MSLDPKIIALKGCRKGYHGPWMIVRTQEKQLRHTCETCGYYEENCRPGEGVYPTEMQPPKITQETIGKTHEEWAIQTIKAEMYRQNVKWGEQNNPFFKWIAIAGEEFGEICQAGLHENHEELEKEVVQLAAVMLQWLVCLQRNRIKTLYLNPPITAEVWKKETPNG